MKVVVAGSLLWDTVHPWRGECREGPGGIAYNVLPLGLLAREGDRVVPVCWMGEEHLSGLRTRWAALAPALDLGHVRVCPAGSDTNVLRYVSRSERRETMVVRCPPLDEAMLEPLLDADLIHFNAITGREFGLRLVRHAASKARGLLMLDVHCLVCRLSRRGNLTRGRWDSWREWAGLVHILQCNQEELRLMLGPSDGTPRAVARGAAVILEGGPECVVVTLAEGGSLVAFRRGGATCCWHTPALTPGRMRDPTGCGDCFTAGFVWGCLAWGEPREAAVLGTVVASQNCTGVGLGAFATGDAARELWGQHERARGELRRAQTAVECAV